jgi:hypothetical protein
LRFVGLLARHVVPIAHVSCEVGEVLRHTDLRTELLK